MSQLILSFLVAVVLTLAPVLIGARITKAVRATLGAALLSVALHALVTWTAKQLINPDGIVLSLTVLLGVLIYRTVLVSRWSFAVCASLFAVIGQVVAMFSTSIVVA